MTNIDATDIDRKRAQTANARAKARETVMRKTDDKMAERLRERGWLVVAPEDRDDAH